MNDEEIPDNVLENAANEINLTEEFAKAKAILYLAKPDKSLKLLSKTTPSETFFLASLSAQAKELDIPFLEDFVTHYLELLVSEKGQGRKDLHDIACIGEQRELNFRERAIRGLGLRN